MSNIGLFHPGSIPMTDTANHQIERNINNVTNRSSMNEIHHKKLVPILFNVSHID